MLIFSCVVLAIPLIVAASGGVSPSVGIFEGLLFPFGPQVARLHSRQSFLVPPDCAPNCEAFSTAVDDCLTPACACTVQNMNTGLTCVECTVSEIPGEAIAGQTVLNNFAEECAAYGFPLNVPTVTPSGTVVPSTGSPTDSATTGSPQDPPTGLPSSLFKGISSAASTSDKPSGGGPTTTSLKASTTLGGKSGAVRVVNGAEVMCGLFSVWLTAVLVTY
ncbi:hypothetical protein V8E52_004733 [Russula decolorans]